MLTSGRLSVGNIVTPVPNSVDLYRVNDGGKPLEFFVRPSKRRPGYQKRLAGPGQVPEAVRRAYDAVGAPLAGSGNSMLTNCRAVLMTLVAVFITVMLHGRFIAEI